MRGDLVIARTYGDRPVVLRVWDHGPRSIYLTDENHFTMMSSGRAVHMTVGFPRDDVYEFDESIATQALARPVWGPEEWDSLKKLSPVPAAPILKP
jgi:hypothetical protein